MKIKFVHNVVSALAILKDLDDFDVVINSEKQITTTQPSKSYNDLPSNVEGSWNWNLFNGQISGYILKNSDTKFDFIIISPFHVNDAQLEIVDLNYHHFIHLQLYNSIPNVYQITNITLHNQLNLTQLNREFILHLFFKKNQLFDPTLIQLFVQSCHFT